MGYPLGPPHQQMDEGSLAPLTWAASATPTPYTASGCPKGHAMREEERGKDRKQTPLRASVCQELCLIVGTR